MSDLLDIPCIAGLIASALAGWARWSHNTATADYAAVKAAEIFVGNAEQTERLKANSIMALAIVSGHCFAGNTIYKSGDSMIENALCLHTVVREVRRVWSKLSNQWEDEKHTISSVSKYLPVVIKNESSSVFVKQPGKMDQVDLPVKAVKFTPAQSTVMDTLATLWKGEEVKGVEIVQEALVEGTEVSSVGELALTASGIELRRPKKGLPYAMLASSVSGLLRHYQDKKDTRRKIYVFLSLVACAFFNYWLYKRMKAVYYWYVGPRQREWAQNISVPAEERLGAQNFVQDIQREPEQPTEVSVCVICLDKPRDTLILPCGHFCTCKRCVNMVAKCPICRTDVQNKLPFYNP